MFLPTDERYNEDHRPFEAMEVPSEDVQCVNCKHWQKPTNGISIFGDKLNMCGNVEADVSGKHFVITAADSHCGEFAPGAEYLEELQERHAA